MRTNAPSHAADRRAPAGHAPARRRRPLATLAAVLGLAATQLVPVPGVTAGLAAAADGTSTDVVVTARTFAEPRGTITGPYDNGEDPRYYGVTGSVGTDYRLTAGAVYTLYQAYPYDAATDVQGDMVYPPNGMALGSCTVAADGACTVTVPSTDVPWQDGGNGGKKYWVYQTTAAPGTYSNPVLTFGDSSLATPVEWQIPGLTKSMVAGETRNIPRTAPFESDRRAISFGALPNSVVNPPVPQRCAPAGLDVALVFDLSSSITTTQRQQYRNAITGNGGIFDVLSATPSRVATFSFGNVSPAAGTNAGNMANHPELVQVSTNRAALNTRINNLIPNNGSTNGTNWDAGLRAVANATQHYDLVLFITDGAPNYVRDTGNGYVAPAATPTDIALASVEAAIFSANAVKAEGTNILAVGVGPGVANAGHNLRAISGQTEGVDYVRGDWSELSGILATLAQAATCQVPVTVSKNVLDAAGSTATATNGWSVSATPGAPSAGTLTQTPTATTQVTAGTGAAAGQASWTLAFSSPGATVDLTVAETPQNGYGWVTTVCTVTHSDGSASTVDLGGTSGTVRGVRSDDRVSCVVTNQPNTATVVVVKQTNEATDETFPFASTLPSSGALAGAGATATDEGFVLPDGGSYTVTVPVIGSGDTPYTVAETDIPAGWRPDGPPVCTTAGQAGTTATLNSSAGAVSISRIDPLVTVTCTFRNTNLPVPATAWTTWKWSNPTSGTADSPASVQPGAAITYYLYASNKEGGNQPVTGLVLTDDLGGVLPYASLPAGFPASGTFVVQDRSDDDPPELGGGPAQPPADQQIPADQRGTVAYDESTGLVTWSIPDLDPGKRLRLSFTVTVDADAYGTDIVNTMTAGSTDAEIPAPEACTADAPCLTYHETPVPSWTVAKTSTPAYDGATPTEVRPGTSITYLVTATNTGALPIADALLTDDLSGVAGAAGTPTGLAWNTPTGTGTVLGAAPAYDPTTQRVTGTVTSLAPGSSVAMQYTVVVGAHAYDASLHNAAWGGSGTVPPAQCATADDPCVTEHVTSSAPVLTLVKRVQDAYGATADPAGWTLTAQVATATASPEDIAGAPAFSGAGTASGSVWSYLWYDLYESGATDDWQVGTDWVCVDSSGGAGGAFYEDPIVEEPGHARVYLAPDADVTCTVVNTPIAPAWTYEKSSDPAGGSTVAPGDVITYTVTARQVDGVPAHGVVLTDDLSAVLDHATLVPGSVSASTGSASATDTTLTWQVGELSGAQTLTYRVQVAADAYDVTLRNAVTGTGPTDAQPCPEERPDCRTTTHETDPAFDDVGIVKTHSTLPGDGSSVEAGDEFEWVLTVTNHGVRDATDVTVTDPVPDRLEVTGVTAPAGWTSTVSGTTVTASTPTLAFGASAEIRVAVRVLDLAQPAVTATQGDVPAATAPVPAASLDNEATVTAAKDDDPSNDRDDDSVPLRDLVAAVTTQCVAGDVRLAFSVDTTPSLAGRPVSFSWVALDGDGNPVTGASPADAGFSPVPLGDVQTVQWPDTDDAWTGDTLVTFAVNPEARFVVAYPRGGECDPATEVLPAGTPTLTIDKTATVREAEAGTAFGYGILVTNTDQAATAAGVVVTDAIPAVERVDRVDAPAGWQSCAVTGRDARGYGGTLRCVLDGTLAPGASAPPIALAVTVDPASTATSVTNTAVVGWYAQGDPSATGTASDSVPVTLLVTAVLASTGLDPWGPLLVAMLAVTGGLALVVVGRKRRREQA